MRNFLTTVCMTSWSEKNPLCPGTGSVDIHSSNNFTYDSTTVMFIWKGNGIDTSLKIEDNT